MNPKDVASWARRFARKGAGAAVQRAPQPAEPAPAYPPPARYQPVHQQVSQVWRGDPELPAGGRIPQYRRLETDTLVRPGPSGYADLLNSVPDLATVGPSGQDAMDQDQNPLLGEFWQSGEAGVQPAGGPPRAYSRPIQGGPVLPLAELQRQPGGEPVAEPAPPVDPAAN